MTPKLPPVPEPSLKDATSFRFRCLHLLVDVEFVMKRGWRWLVYRPEWVGKVVDSPKWHRTAVSATRSAWAYLRKEARQVPPAGTEWEVVKEPRIPSYRDRDWMCWHGRHGKYCGTSHGNGKVGFSKAERHCTELNGTTRAPARRKA